MTDDSEEWRLIVGCSQYEVSNTGRVRSWAERNRKGCEHVPPKILSQLMLGDYLSVGIRYDNDTVRKRKLVHILVNEAWHGPKPDGHVTRHLDGNKFNNNQENLAWGTESNNKRDQIEHGTWVRGERSGHAKLTEQQVIEIRSNYMTMQQLADKYGVSRACILGVVRGKKWKHIPFGTALNEKYDEILPVSV